MREPGSSVEISPAELEARWARPLHPSEVADRLAGIDVPWYVAGGWALDLFKGEQTRAHADTEIAVPAGHFTAVRTCFPRLVVDVPEAGRIWTPATSLALSRTHQTWFRDPTTGEYRLDVFREPHDGGTWICRRLSSLRRPYTEIIAVTPDGIPYLIPEIVLLFKAKARRPQDEDDLRTTLPYLNRTRREDLASVLAQAHPGHAWLTEIG